MRDEAAHSETAASRWHLGENKMGEKYFAVKPQLLSDRSKGWRGMVRIEATGSNVADVAEAERHYVPQKLIYAEGDTWFKKFSPLPLSSMNLLDAIRVPFH